MATPRRDPLSLDGDEMSGLSLGQRQHAADGAASVLVAT